MVDNSHGSYGIDTNTNGAKAKLVGWEDD